MNPLDLSGARVEQKAVEEYNSAMNKIRHGRHNPESFRQTCQKIREQAGSGKARPVKDFGGANEFALRYRALIFVVRFAGHNGQTHYTIVAVKLDGKFRAEKRADNRQERKKTRREENRRARELCTL